MRRAAIYILTAFLLFAAGSVRVAVAAAYAPPSNAPDVVSAADGFCTLREAITAAITNTASGQCPAGSSTQTDVITLASGALYTLTLTASDNSNAAGDLDFTGADGSTALDVLITTNADEPATIVQTAANERVIEIFAATVRLENVVILSGEGGSGAGIRVLGGALELDRVTFSENHVTDGASWGGGLYVAPEATASIANSQFIANSAEGGYGGAIFTAGVTAIEATLFEDNAARAGGALATNNTITTVVNSTLADNTSGLIASGSGGDIQATSGATLHVINSTLVDAQVNNSTNPTAAVIAEGGSTAYIRNSIVAPVGVLPACRALDVPVDSSIIASNNRVGSAGSDCDGPATAVLSANSLTALGDHGGQTPTFLLRPGSNAADAGDSATCEPTDARGVARRLAANLCDAGAVEMFRLTLAAVGGTPESGTVNYSIDIAPSVPSGVSMSVYAFTAQSSATAGVDYGETSQMLVFDQSHSSRTFSVSHIADDIDEADEYYSITVQQDDHLIVPPAPFIGTITDDDTAGISITTAPASLAEGGAPQLVVIELDSRPTADVTIEVSFQAEDIDVPGGSTGGAEQFVVSPALWENGITFGVQAIADDLNEGNEVELVSIFVRSLDPLYDDRFVMPLNITILDADANLVVNGGFEQDGSGGANASNKKALGWAASPKASASSRRECKPSGDGSPCAWLFKGSGTISSIVQSLALPDYDAGDMLLMTGSAKRTGITRGASAKLQLRLSDGQKDMVTYKFSAGSDTDFTPFSRQLALNVPPEDVESATITLTNKATSGKIYFDDIGISVQPRFPRGGRDTLPPPELPSGLRGPN